MDLTGGPTLYRTPSGIIVVPAIPEEDLSLQAPPTYALALPTLATALAAFATKLVEAGVREFFAWLFSRGDSSGDLQRLLRQFCEFICSFVFRTVEEARIKARLDAAEEKLESVNFQLGLAAGAKNPIRYYEPLLTQGLLGLAIVAYKGLSDEVGDVAYINYAIAATLELKVISELIHRGSELVSVEMFRERVEGHKAYLDLSSTRLKNSIRKGIKVGACFYPLEDGKSFPPTSAGEPGAPETRDFEADEGKQHFTSQTLMQFWIARLDPYAPEGIVVLKYFRDAHPVGPRAPTLNAWAREYISDLRRSESELVQKSLAALHDSALEPVAKLLAVWPRLLERPLHLD